MMPRALSALPYRSIGGAVPAFAMAIRSTPLDLFRDRREALVEFIAADLKTVRELIKVARAPGARSKRLPF